MKPTSTDPRAAVLDRINELPPLPMVVHELLAVMRDAECSGEDVNRILSSDQALAGKILRLVNSSFYGLPGQVNTIPRAVVILGHAAIRNLATGLAVAGSLGNRLPPERRQHFWRHALASAAGAEVIARHVKMEDPEEAFIAGLLHDIGHLILMMVLPAEHDAVHERGLLGNIEQERLHIGLDHCRAGRDLLKHWKLPASLIGCVRLHHAPDACCNGETPLLTVVALADRLTRVLGAAGEGLGVEGDIVDLAAALRLSPDEVLGLVPAIRDRMIEARSFLKMAEIEDDLVPADADVITRTAVVVGEDPARVAWLSALALHHGLKPRDVREWLVDPAPAPGTVIFYDAADLTPARAERLAPLLERHQGVVFAIGTPRPDAPRRGYLAKAVSLSMAFSAADLDLERLCVIARRLDP